MFVFILTVCVKLFLLPFFNGGITVTCMVRKTVNLILFSLLKRDIKNLGQILGMSRRLLSLLCPRSVEIVISSTPCGEFGLFLDTLSTEGTKQGTDQQNGPCPPKI